MKYQIFPSNRKIGQWFMWLALAGQLLANVIFAPATLHAAQLAPESSSQLSAQIPPTARFTSDVESGLMPLLVHFRDESLGAPVGWAWDFGDGATSAEQHPLHTYTTPGAYSVRLRVTNAAGTETQLRKNLIVVNSEPVIEPVLSADEQFFDAFGYDAKEQIFVPFVQLPAPAPADTETIRAAAAPNTPTLQNPLNGATGVSTPSTTLSSCVSDPDGGNLSVTFYGRDISPISVPDFTIAVIPDTQFYHGNKGEKATFQAQVDWIVANKASRNIVFVTHLGDVVEDGSNPGNDGGDSDGSSTEQWIFADQVMATIEDPITTNLLDGIPYGIAVGNHDQGPSFGDPDKTTLYNQYFGISRFAGRQYYGGHLGSDNDNSYQLFSVGDLDFIAVHIEYDVSSRPNTFAWVDSILQTYADRLAILSAHELIHSKNNGEWRPQGEKIWNGVKDNPNIFLMTSGHIGGEGRRNDTGYHGNTVNTLLSDYQNRNNGGDGWMRFMEFSGANSSLTTRTYSPTRSEYETDPDSLFTVAWDTPSSGPLRRPFEIIGQKSNVSSGTCTSTTWSGLESNHEYEWYVGVTDSPGNLGVAQKFSSRATFSTASVNALNFSNSTYQVDEDGGSATVTVNLNRVNNDAVTVAYATSNGTAAAGSDYTAASGTLTFSAGQTSKSFAIAIVNDSLYEGDETVNLSLSNPSNAVLGAPASATLTIGNDDSAPTVMLETATYSVNESAGPLTVDVVLNKASALPVTVNYATSNNTAKSGEDYTAQNGTMTINAGDTRKSLTIPIENDAAPESSETFNLALSSPSNATLGTPDSAVITILDDDSTSPVVQFAQTQISVNEDAGSAVIGVELNSAAAQSVSVEYTINGGSAQSGSDYTAINGALTFGVGETSKSFTIAIHNDLLDELDETVDLLLSNPSSNATLGANASASLTIVDNDSALIHFSNSNYTVNEGSDAEALIEVQLTTPSARTVSVAYATSGGTAEPGSDFTTTSGTLTFAPGESSKTFAIPIADDLVDESSETVALTLTDPVEAALGSPSTALLTIDDDDTNSLRFERAAYAVAENAGQVSITVLLNAPAVAAVSVNFATGSGTAAAESDYTATSGTLTFAPGETSQSFEIPIVDDARDETDETVQLLLSSPVNAVLGTPATALLTIDDDDIVQFQFSQTTYSVTESAGAATIDVTLNHPSANLVAVQFAASDGTAVAGRDYTATSGTLTFAPGETQRSFTVPISDNELDDVDRTINLTLQTPTGAALGTPASARLTILDDDNALIQFDRATYSAPEEGGSLQIDVTLNTSSTSAVTVDYQTVDGSANQGSDYAATAGVLTFAAGETRQSFSISILDDALAEENETITLLLSNPHNGTLGAQATAELTIVDNERVSVQFGRDTYQANEGDGVIHMDVLLTNSSIQIVSVDYLISGGSATAGEDFTLAAGTLAFSPGEVRKTLAIKMMNDLIDEADETLTLTLQNAQNANIGPQSAATLTIVDNDSPPLISLGGAQYQFFQGGGGELRFTIRLSSKSAKEIQVGYHIATGVVSGIEGVQGGDIQAGLPITGTVVFAPGEDSKAVSLTLSAAELNNLGPAATIMLDAALNADVDVARDIITIPMTNYAIYLPVIQHK